MTKPIGIRVRQGLIVLALLLPCVLCFSPSEADARPRMTRFSPEKHSFRFDNSFSNDVFKTFDIRTGGLCGGMVYSALDYFNKRMPIPFQTYRPANRTRLQSYIYNRQVKSLAPNLPKWANLGVNVEGRRNNAFFQQSIRGTPGGELRKLRQLIDRGSPAPLGLQSYGGKIGDEDSPGNHQVLAIGYELGRYVGDGRTHVGDLKILIYDPNHPKKTMTLVADARDRSFYYVSGTTDMKIGTEWRYRYRAFFTDTHYSPSNPPVVRNPNYTDDGKVREILVECKTADDDLRGGKDNVNLTLHLADGTKVKRGKINLGARWLSNYVEWARVALPHPVPKSQIRAVELSTTFGGGVGGDNWDLRQVYVHYYEGSDRKVLTSRRHLFRFTGRAKSLRIAVRHTEATVPAGAVTKLRLEIRTGGDDLRGNNDNADVVILTRDGRRQTRRSINNRQRWADNSDHVVTIALDRAVPRADVVSVIISFTGRGGMGGDNWNMDALKIIPYSAGSELPPYYDERRRPLHRFTAKRKGFTARW